MIEWVSKVEMKKIDIKYLKVFPSHSNEIFDKSPDVVDMVYVLN
jgi:hypothetical protein